MRRMIDHRTDPLLEVMWPEVEYKANDRPLDCSFVGSNVVFEESMDTRSPQEVASYYVVMGLLGEDIFRGHEAILLRELDTREQEDGAKVVRVENLNNPYKNQANFDRRFKLTLNKLYAWSLVDYDRVVMLDSDNLFLRKTDELFQCGQFCAVFINPCIFHTGLFVLQPSMEVFKNMIHELEIGKENKDGADQGFIGGYFPDLLDQPLFHPPVNGTKLEGTYGAEMPLVFIQAVFYLGIVAVTRLARPSLSKLCYRRADKSISFIQTGLKMIAVWSVLAAYIFPVFIIPHTVHPLVGWSLYLLGASALSSIAVNAFLLPILPVLIPWLGILGTLLVMACPWYPDGVVRALAVFVYAFCCAPILWGSMVKILSCLQVSLEREAFLPRLGESTPPAGFNKLY
ncbi:hypothetical protein RJ639_028061 [Escallonia herrerae]|uniref:Glucuronosyltransferase PGSIP8 n=1 Tax=Escallonia herrerae TaxID=1293975 RepID=A0AA89BDM4_9ASTE|nr:hypothetical protein RJ639_028061 [Escallonia herrerae]